MVCRTGQLCTIELSFFTGNVHKPRYGIDKYMLHASTYAKDLYEYIEQQYDVPSDSFVLYLLSDKNLINLSRVKDKTMSELGVDFSFDNESSENEHKLVVVDLTDTLTYQIGILICNRETKEFDYAPSASSAKKSYALPYPKPRRETCYVGLVNQAMTCYLNSLLQALYMTPEFRNALYNWEYVEALDKDEANSMPYQLQKLFLTLQISTKPAVETTALTKSFGWNSTEAWQQHDIQELCRVMFDALEQKFANTEQADLINRLYEGKMIDYVKCLECGTEKSREDTFLDIPLPIRSFGNNIAYNSVEEALQAFVQHETLEGANQYHCDKCNKKCDAHKGLKFTKFPYLLTLHLKRFDFDYETFHRIKLNDKVTFPDVLNLNSFIATSENQELLNSKEEVSVTTKCDDNSTTDSGGANDDCPVLEGSLTNSNHSENHDPDDDEGIDMNNGPSTSNNSPHNLENEKNHVSYSPADGPYQYELFSIMIHSGSASGGHYYAYIKDFRTQEWLCFNDQNVNQITRDDIQKTYGGGPSRAYYNGAFSSSTNAYMLMYRQIDPARNALPMQVQDFPKHIQELVKKIKENDEDSTGKNKDADKKINFYARRPAKQNRPYDDLYMITIYYRHPTGELEDTVIFEEPQLSMLKVKQQAYAKFDLEKVVSLNQCRLVSYDPHNDFIEQSYSEEKEFSLIGEIWPKQNRVTLLMEIRRKEEKFQTYLPGVMTKVYVVDESKGEIIDGPLNIRAQLTHTVKEYKQMLATTLNLDLKQMKIPTASYQKDDVELQALKLSMPTKVFVSCVPDADTSTSFESPFLALTTRLQNVISLDVELPDTSKKALEAFNIPPLEGKSDKDQVVEREKCTEQEKSTDEEILIQKEKSIEDEKISESKKTINKEKNNENEKIVEEEKIIEKERSIEKEKSTEKERFIEKEKSTEKETFPEKENSIEKEKSVPNGPSKSITNDTCRDNNVKCNEVSKTVRNNEETPARDMSPQLGDTEEWNTPEQSNSEDSSLTDSDKTLVGDAPEDDDFLVPHRLVFDRPCDNIRDAFVFWDIDDVLEYYFKATPCTNNSQKSLNVLVDRRMNLSTLKKKLEPYVGVPAEYFNVYRHSSNASEAECSCSIDRLHLSDDGEKFSIKLGCVLRPGEFKFKLYQLRVNNPEPYRFLGEWIFFKDMTIGQAKKEILAEIKKQYDVDIPYERCLLRRKCVKAPSKILLDHQKFEECHIPREMIIQELLNKEPVTDPNQILLLVKRWLPAKMRFGPFQEIVMNEKSMDELKRKIFAISDIPEEYIDITTGSFVSEISISDTPYEPEWGDQNTEALIFTLKSSTVVYYRDTRDDLHPPSQEAWESWIKNSRRHPQYFLRPSRSNRRRERELKIQ